MSVLIFLQTQTGLRKRFYQSELSSKNSEEESGKESDIPYKTDMVTKNDIDSWLGHSSSIKPEEKAGYCWEPPESYDFKEGAKNLKRKFNHKWLFAVHEIFC
ncbi:hypothetical protein HHI36_009430 [Cryptolaemus montrouzieri]|uniref:Uncharacterized protein n=1 Tax=Cryptolaemus montrouzieri TaxID=559131 RepID=A0ABD2MFC6_9CUCU